MSNETRRAAHKIGDSRALTILARFGFAASGLVHLLLGLLAIQTAFNQQNQTDQSGALAAISELPGGAVVLWIAVVGLFALGLWLVVQAVLGIGSSSKKRWVRSIVSLGKAVAYIALGATALTFAQGGQSDSGDSTSQATATVLALPAGQLLVVLIGVIALAIGAYFVFKGVTRKFEEDLTVPSGTAGRVTVGMGIAGYVAKGIAVGVVGILFIVAAVTVDPSSSTGLDGALGSLAALPFGVVILSVVGLGLIVYGLYTFVRARYARI